MPLKESETKLLLALLRNRETPIMSLPKFAGLGGSAVYNSVRWLSERGLVTDRWEKVPPRRHLIKLTEKGRRTAELLEDIEKQL